MTVCVYVKQQRNRNDLKTLMVKMQYWHCTS